MHEDPTDDRVPDQGARLSVQGLCHAFGDGTQRREILLDVAVDFMPGQITLILGPSGSGKTTFLTLVGALRSIQKGSVILGGLELKGARPGRLTSIRRQIGFIFQNHHLLKALTAMENIQISMACDPGETEASSREKAAAALAQVGLSSQAQAYPHQLSHGQRQRVAVARALVHRPQVILADEPTASLDRAAGMGVVDLLQEHARTRGCAILLVTHDKRIMDSADCTLLMEDGCLRPVG
jgi:putative ABC transport system ATP-binding protein